MIVRIDETDITAENYSEAVSMLYGAAGTKMNIVVRRGVEDSTLPDMTRRFVEVPSVYSSMLENQIGLVVIKDFADNTPDQFTKQVDRLIDEGAQGLVFDVRGVSITSSGTSALDSVAEALDKLLPPGYSPRPSTRRDGWKTPKFPTRGRSPFRWRCSSMRRPRGSRNSSRRSSAITTRASSSARRPPGQGDDAAHLPADRRQRDRNHDGGLQPADQSEL